MKENHDNVELEKYIISKITPDASGLAKTLNKVIKICNSYKWMVEDEWGIYDYSQRTVDVLQEELEEMMDSLKNVCEAGLKESGDRVRENIQNVRDDLKNSVVVVLNVVD